MTSTGDVMSARQPSKALNVSLWIAQVLLGVFFLMAGITHGIRPVAAAATMAPWVVDVPFLLLRFIGTVELIGAFGVVVPAATRIKPGLTPLAALGLMVIMLLAIAFHITRGEASTIGVHIVVAAVAGFVAWGRWRKAPIAPRPR